LVTTIYGRLRLYTSEVVNLVISVCSA